MPEGCSRGRGGAPRLWLPNRLSDPPLLSSLGVTASQAASHTSGTQGKNSGHRGRRTHVRKPSGENQLLPPSALWGPIQPPTRAADTGSIGPGRPHSPERILTHAGRTCAAGSPRRLAAAPQVPPVPLAWELHPREPDALSPQNAHPNTNSSSVSNFQNVESTQMSMD